MFDKKSIKKYKGSRVKLTYLWNGSDHSITGTITANITSKLIFKVSKGDDKDKDVEIPISYSKIQSIEKLRSYASYMKVINKYIEEEKYVTAHDILTLIKPIFHLKEQRKGINKLKVQCVHGQWYKTKLAIRELELRKTIKEITDEKPT